MCYKGNNSFVTVDSKIVVFLFTTKRASHSNSDRGEDELLISGVFTNQQERVLQAYKYIHLPAAAWSSSFFLPLMMRHVLCVLLFFIAHHQAFSSSPPTSLPSNNQYATSNDSKSAADYKKSGDNKSPTQQSSSAVTFLYELYEHEIYNPSTDSWTSRRFTQSPITGGGGRDSTSRKF